MASQSIKIIKKEKKIPFNPLVDKLLSGEGAKKTLVRNQILGKSKGFKVYRESTKCLAEYLNEGQAERCLRQGIEALEIKKEGLEIELLKVKTKEGKKKIRTKVTNTSSELDFLKLMAQNHSRLVSLFDSSEVTVIAQGGSFTTNGMTVTVSPCTVFMVKRNGEKFLGAIIPHLRNSTPWKPAQAEFATWLIYLYLDQLSVELGCSTDKNLVLCVHKSASTLYSLAKSIRIKEVQVREYIQGLMMIWEAYENDPLLVKEIKDLKELLPV